MKIMSTIVNTNGEVIKDVSSGSAIGVAANVTAWLVKDKQDYRHLRGLLDAMEAVNEYGFSLQQCAVED